MGVAAELTADETRIALVAAGAVEDVRAVAGRLGALTPLIKPTEPRGGLVMPATWPAVVQLASALGDGWRPGPRLREWAGREAARRSAPPAAALRAPVPDGLVPRPYQIAGARMIAATGRALILDEPGTGKTVTAILGLSELIAEGTRALPVLVICPAGVVDPWVVAFRSWAPRLRAIAWRGGPARRRALAGTADAYVASYDTARVDAAGPDPARAPLVALGARALVVDEHHMIKNPRAARTAAVLRLARGAEALITLSGTPITHHPGDLWPALRCLAPGAWPSRERWVNRYCVQGVADYGEAILGLDPGMEPELRLALRGQHRRVAKADVLAQLPPKVYSLRTVELPPRWRKAYDDMEADMLAELPDGGELSVMSALARLTRLSQLASSAAEVAAADGRGADGSERQRVSVRLKAPSWKVDALLEVLAERPGQAAVAFAPSRQLILLAADAARAAGLRVGLVIGGQSMAERAATVAALQRGALDLVCATTGAGGTGLTLTAASTVVFLQRPWSLVESIQAEDRCHRIGSERHASVEVIDIVAARTVDSRVRAALREKAGQLADLVRDPRIVAELLGGAAAREARKDE